MAAIASAAKRNGRTSTRSSTRGRAVAPILARHLRNGIEESVHRGDIVEVDAAGRVIRQLGDPDRIVTLRSTVKPFGLLALIEAGGVAAFDLEPAELAILASSHSGEDLHVRTLQGLYRRSGVSQALLASRQDFNKSMVNLLNQTASDMTAADSGAETAQINALQTRQQLAVKTMAITNQRDQMLINLL
jgi:L-asparaginase II